MERPLTIALDGPSGAGKSTIAKQLAQKLGIIYLDTGAMYRAVGLLALRENADVRDARAITELMARARVDIRSTDAGQRVYLCGEDVTDAIRTQQVSAAASAVSAVPAVREAMVRLQREFAAGRAVVMDGRDIGTHVLPDATLKVFVTASLEERARRRYEELRLTQDTTLERVREAIAERDLGDTTRAHSPLVKASNARELDTTSMSVEQVVSRILAWAEEVR